MRNATHIARLLTACGISTGQFLSFVSLGVSHEITTYLNATPPGWNPDEIANPKPTQLGLSYEK
jgi:hypothetical protein